MVFSKPMNYLEVNGRNIGPGQPVYIIAELSGNHHQNKDKVMELIRAAKAAGADAIKSQTYTPDTITVDSHLPAYIIHSDNPAWDGRSLHDLYGEAYTPWAWQADMKTLCDSLSLDFFASAFDPTAVDFLDSLGVPLHKAASFEMADIPLIEHMARTNKPLVLSTGMASLAEIDEAVTAARAVGARQLALLRCTSEYPASPANMHLRAIPNLAQTFNVPVGLSDHTIPDYAIPVAAVTLGASLIEKHFIMSRAEGGPDAAFSLEPAEFAAMVKAVRMTEQALGEVRYGIKGGEAPNIVFRRSLIATQDIKAGEKLTTENVQSKRPGIGLPPKFLNDVVGHLATQDIPKGTPLTWELVGKKVTKQVATNS